MGEKYELVSAVGRGEMVRIMPAGVTNSFSRKKLQHLFLRKQPLPHPGRASSG